MVDMCDLRQQFLYDVDSASTAGARFLTRISCLNELMETKNFTAGARFLTRISCLMKYEL